MEIQTHNESETIAVGKEFAARLKGGDVVCLYGDLGAGKSTLVRGIALGLGVAQDITSPTFTLMNVYRIARNPHHVTHTLTSTHNSLRDTRYEIRELAHIDTYRLKDAEELVNIGVLDYLGQPEVVTIIEWPEKVQDLLHGKNIIEVNIKHATDDKRIIKINP